MIKRIIPALLALCLFSGCVTRLEEAPPPQAAELFTSYYIAGEYQTAWDMFDEAMKTAVSAEDLQAIWDSICQPMALGPFESVYSMETAPELVEGMYYVTTVLLKHASADTLFAITIAEDAQGRIAGLSAEMAPNPGAAELSAMEEPLIVGKGTDFPLDAVLSMPQSDAPVPAVVLVHGSGPNDMDETIGPNKPFKDIADYLSAQGIAVLRYDKRPYAHGQSFYAIYGMNFTVYEEVIDDAILAKRLLEADPRIDPGRIYVLGHSLGGMLAPVIADEGGFAGMIIMAGTTRALPEIMVEQMEYLYGLEASLSDEEREALIMEAKAEYEKFVIAMDLPGDELKDMLIFGNPAHYFVHMAKLPISETLTAFEGPILIQQGKMDYQVRFERDFSIYEELTSGMGNVQLAVYDNLTHLFTPSFSETGMGVPADYENPGHVDEAPLTDILTFIHKSAL
ncbi:MAG: alpha/beta fold hydrolase [Clostridiales bacterium]|jgi:esterase/lipase|nr:alpha/beta fold hydrolase [Clostridiales bacterium]